MAEAEAAGITLDAPAVKEEDAEEAGACTRPLFSST
jgi:hypothetical protein